MYRLQSEYNSIVVSVDTLRKERKSLHDSINDLDGINQENIVIIQTLRNQLTEALQSNNHR